MSAPNAPNAVPAVAKPLTPLQAKLKAENEAKRIFEEQNITITLKVSFHKSIVAQTMAEALKDTPYLGGYAENPECAEDIFNSFKGVVQRLSDAERWALLRLAKPSEGAVSALCSSALTKHGDAIAEAHADTPALEAELATALAERKAEQEAEAKAKAQAQMEADALAYRKLVAEQEAKKAKRLASAPAPAEGGSVASSERPKAKKRPEGISDADWEADVARRERNARNSKASEERKKALGIEVKPLTEEDKARRATMTAEQIKAEMDAKKKETRRLVKEAEARLKAQAEAAGGGGE